MNEKLNEINLEHFEYDYFIRNDNRKCIEISNSNLKVPVNQFLLYIDHTDCSPLCFVNGKISKTEKQLSDINKFDIIKSDRKKNRFKAIVTAKNIQSVYELYLQVCLTERCLLLPMRNIINKEVNWPLRNEQYQCDNVNSVDSIVDILKEDCWFSIFSYLDMNDLFALASVCTDIRALVQQDRRVSKVKSFHFKFYDKYFETGGKEIFSDKSVVKMRQILECIGYNLEDISISVGRTSNEFRIFETFIRNVGTNLHTLRLSNFCWLSIILESTSSTVFEQIRTLHLDSQYYDIPISVDIKMKFPNLEKLELHGRWKLDDFSNWLGITELILDRLISLNHTSWMTWMTDVSSHFSNLVTLNVTNTMKRTIIPLENVECLLKLTHLRKIQIEILNQHCFDVLLEMTQLTCVSLIFYSSIQEVIEDQLFKLACHLTHLEQFDITLKEEAFLPRDDLIKLISIAYHLKSIHLINDTIKIFLFIAPSFLHEILDARKQSQETYCNKSLLLVAFSKCFIDETVFKEATETTFRDYILLKNYTRAY